MALSKGFRIFEKKQPNHSIILEHRQRTQEALLFESQAVAVLCKSFTWFIFSFLSHNSIIFLTSTHFFVKIPFFYHIVKLFTFSVSILTTCYVICEYTNCIENSLFFFFRNFFFHVFLIEFVNDRN